MKKLYTLIGAFCLLATASAQTTKKVVADKIVGIVGDKIILKSDVYNDIIDRQRRGEPVPPNANCYIMDQLLTLKALVLQADKDSIVVPEDEIEALLENQIRGFIQMYGSKDALQQIAGRTVYQIKEDFRQSFTERKKAERMRDNIVSNVKITPQEVKEYFDKIPKDSLRFYESEVEISEVILYPKASRDLEMLAIEELNDYKKQAEAGAQRFETLAQLYSDDPGSKENGGSYGINRTEKQMDPAFISNAFRLKEKQISPVFKSKFGYHIIKMESRAGDDAIVRHILRIPKITDDEVNEAIERLDSVRAKLIAGTMTFGEAVAKYSDDEAAKYTGGRRMNQGGGTFLALDQLDKETVELLAKTKMKPGEYSKPVTFMDERQKKGVRIVYLQSRTEPHRENMKDDYDRVAQRALEMKKQEVLEKWFASRISSYYLMIDDEFRDCDSLDNWLRYSVKTNP
ncbi:MAG: peptidylprolyl isomerase [Candidatus Pseudobacter hemicellulosilyticus]|uniref:Peptidylprolyl isomerase n=1 Tax=Candidatus Pseudobacter hemicellulosilyticus TaxID=3121375 RepID=A0AAJ6BGV4_9BACT|nr:MAG: peptidylprolyl isomerase [Pseudobacter sp.]